MKKEVHLVTGAAGFIGYHLSKVLLEGGKTVVGLDCLNDYYDVKLKTDRLALLKKYPLFYPVICDICDYESLEKLSKCG